MSGRPKQSSFRKHKTDPDQLSKFTQADLKQTKTQMEKGPFKYEPLQNIAHPIQPDDDISVRDPTLRTVDRSKLSQSIFHHNSLQISLREKISEQDESPFLITFATKLTENIRRSFKSKQVGYFWEKLTRRFKIDKRTQQFQYLYDQENDIIDSNWAFLPSSKIVKFWNLGFFLILHCIAIYVPLSNSLTLMDFNYPFLMCKAFDVLIQLTSSISQNGIFLTNFQQIVKNYSRNNLLHDFIMILSLILLNIFPQNYYILTLLLISLIKRYFDLEIQLKFEYNLFSPLFLFLTAIIKVCLIIHISTCYWHGLFEHESYLHSFHLVLSIFTFNSTYQTASDDEMLLFSLFSFFSLIGNAIFFTQCKNIFKGNRISEQLSEFLAINKLDSNLKLKIINHVVNQPKFYHNQFISKLSGQLMHEFNQAQRSQLLAKYFLNYNPNTLQTLVNYCEDLICQPNQVIVSETEQDDCSLYFILEGNFKVVNRMGIQLQLLGPQQIFGEISFYTQQPRTAAVVSEGVCRLLRIRRDIFLNLLTFNDKQLFYNKRDRILMNHFPCKCFCCLSEEHCVTKCPLLTYKPDRELILKKFIFPKRNPRKHQFKRREKKDLKAYEFLKDAQANQELFVQLYSDNHFQSSYQISQSNLPYDDVYIRESYASAQSFSRMSRERSLLKSTSLLKQQSNYEPQQSIMNDVQIYVLFRFMETTDKQYISQEGEMDDDKFISLVRKDQQKNTFATAGFGQQGQSMKDQKSLNVIVENESSENSFDIDSPQVEQPSQIRKKDPKLTFNYNFDNQMNETQNKYNQFQRNATDSFNNSVLKQDVIQASIRQNSSRSQTYSPITSNNLTANSHRSIIHSQTPSIPRNRRSTNSNYTANKYTDNSELQSRKGTKKRSTKTGTKVSIAPSQFQPFSGAENPIDQTFGWSDFEKMYLFEWYLPHNNYDVTIVQAQKNKKKLKKMSHYFSEYRLALQIQKLKAKQKNMIS